MTIEPGDPIRALTATQEWITLRAASPVESGRDFPVIWVCDEESWAASAGGRPESSLPWPAEAVKQLKEET